MGTAKKILVIDDDQGICRFLSRSLQLRGYGVDAFSNPDEGVDRLLHEEYHLALIDIQMPGWSGLQACTALRGHTSTRSLPVILMTAFYQDPQDIQLAKTKAGATALLLKPFTLDDLFVKIEALIGPAHKPPATDHAQIEGTLARTSLPNLLHNLYTLKATGLLHLERDEVRKVVYCQNGYPIFVRSNLVRECLGKMLVRDRAISTEACELSLAKMKESGRMQGTVLMELGLLSPHQLHDALRRQVTEKLIEVFAWNEGNFRFLPAAKFKAGITTIELSPAALILQGVQRYWTAVRIDAFLEPFLERYLTPIANPHFRFQNMELSHRQADLLAEIKGSLTTNDLLERHALARNEVSQLLTALIMSRMIEPVAKPTRDKAIEPGAAPSPRTTGRLRETILTDYGRMSRQDHFALLGIGRDASSEDIRRSYFNLAKRYHPDRFVHDHLSADLQEKMQTIFHQLNQAYETLSDPVRRHAYLKQLDHKGTEQSREAAENLLQAEVAFRKGQILVRKGDFAGALSFLKPALKISPQEPEYLTTCAWALHRAHPGDKSAAAEAREMLLQSADINPGLDLTHLYLGYLLREDGRDNEAERRFEMAVMSNPDCTEALRELRLIQLRRENAAPTDGLLRRWFRKEKNSP